MNLLGFDLSSRQGSIAFQEENRRMLSRFWPNDRRNSAGFFSALHEMMMNRSSVGMIIVGVGPGSYTGTRIAISAAIGLGLTTGATLHGLSSLVTLSTDHEYAAIGNARRSSYFFASVCDGVVTNAPELLDEAELETRIHNSTVPVYTSDDLPQFASVPLRFPSAELLCQQALAFPQNLLPSPLSPIYLREPHITCPGH